jgi:hypothetical protein
MSLVTIPSRLLNYDPNTSGSKGAKIGSAAALTASGARIATFYSDFFSTDVAWIDKDGVFHGALAGNASTATALASSGTTDQYWRGDNTWGTPAGGGATSTVTVTCTAAEAVGDFVYINSSGVARTASCSVVSTVPAIGVINSKPTTTSCVVQYLGTYSTTGLTPGATYCVSDVGRPALAPVGASGAKLYYQSIGVALDAGTLLLVPTTHIAAYIHP